MSSKDKIEAQRIITKLLDRAITDGEDWITESLLQLGNLIGFDATK